MNFKDASSVLRTLPLYVECKLSLGASGLSKTVSLGPAESQALHC